MEGTAGQNGGDFTLDPGAHFSLWTVAPWVAHCAWPILSPNPSCESQKAGRQGDDPKHKAGVTLPLPGAGPRISLLSLKCCLMERNNGDHCPLEP